jgi:Flp pilus assembly pilin Flp
MIKLQTSLDPIGAGARQGVDQLLQRVGIHLAGWYTRECGQDMVEYALILGFVAVVCLIAIASAGGGVEAVFSATVNKLSILLN